LFLLQIFFNGAKGRKRKRGQEEKKEGKKERKKRGLLVHRRRSKKPSLLSRCVPGALATEQKIPTVTIPALRSVWSWHNPNPEGGNCKHALPLGTPMGANSFCGENAPHGLPSQLE
jgi:hypothetical protein